MATNYCRLDEVEATFEAVQHAFHLLVKKLYSLTPRTTQSLCRALSLLFYTAAKYNECCHKADLLDKANKDIKNLMTRVKTTMANGWIVKHFTQIFGSPSGTKFTKLKEDISVS